MSGVNVSNMAKFQLMMTFIQVYIKKIMKVLQKLVKLFAIHELAEEENISTTNEQKKRNSS